MPLKSKFFKHLSQCSLRTYNFPYFLTLRLARPDFSAKSRLWPGWGTVRDGQIGPSQSAVIVLSCHVFTLLKTIYASNLVTAVFLMYFAIFNEPSRLHDSEQQPSHIAHTPTFDQSTTVVRNINLRSGRGSILKQLATQ